ncbi:MAG: MFS transporter [Pseudomonadales bacterium]
MSERTATGVRPLFTSGYTRYVLGVLVAVYIFNFIDRQILAILAQSIKEDLALSDTQIGALSGIAFGIFYATLGIPIARLADRRSRVNVISVCLAIWSAMTALSGLAQNYWQLLIARIGVGIGEAGGSPPSHSLIADYFTPDARATALGVYALGIPVGILFGNLAGGWINEFFGWRNAFLVVGIPGVLLALTMKLTVREPPRGYSEGRRPDTTEVPFREVIRTMWGFRSFRQLAFGAATQAFVGYGSIAWLPSFLIRAHDMSSGQVGAGHRLRNRGTGGRRGLSHGRSLPFAQPVRGRRVHGEPLHGPDLRYDPEPGTARHARGRLRAAAVHSEHHRSGARPDAGRDAQRLPQRQLAAEPGRVAALVAAGRELRVGHLDGKLSARRPHAA